MTKALTTRSKNWEDEFDPIDGPEATYAPEIPEPEVKVRKARGRRGMDGLFDLVSSKNARDVTRKADWIADTPFQQWNEKDMKRNNGKQRYWGRLEDYDNDGMPIEYVIRRGKADGPVIAVNGYTTKKSDYPWKYEYYDKYPTQDDRKETKFGDFMTAKYGPKYGNDNMTVESYVLDPETDRKTQRIKKNGGYTYPVPVNRTPYQAFSSLVVHPVINSIIKDDIAKGNEEMAKEIRKKISLNSGKGPGFASVFCSMIYEIFISKPITELLTNNGMMKQYIDMYIQMKKRSNPKFTFDANNKDDGDKFTTWVYARKEFKEAAKLRTKAFISVDKIDATKGTVKKIIAPRIQSLLNGSGDEEDEEA